MPAARNRVTIHRPATGMADSGDWSLLERETEAINDVWGDTVNTASRMESTGIPDRVQVTPETHERLRDVFDFEPRGLVEVKGKGLIETWFLVGRRPTDAPSP